MTGWIIAFAGAALAFAALLFVGRIPRSAREITAAALLLGLAGYAWQGHPGIAGAPRQVRETKREGFDEALAEKRRGLAERFGPAAQWLMLSDGLARQGKTKDAANVLLSGLRATPDDPNLWLGLGNALVAHGEGAVSPGAAFAYRRALGLAPDAPAPRYFYGLALARAGDLQAARDLWAPLAASAPADSQVKAELEANIARIDAMLASPR
ncbi:MULTISPECIES: tetratricopeptide repeat protein [unclassified Sphingobium]|uniref:tetratricopeptide repeat protein n=1 Tax=unclassified Sphingobium TaxID=2611147 RepID=UPI0035A67AA9